MAYYERQKELMDAMSLVLDDEIRAAIDGMIESANMLVTMHGVPIAEADEQMNFVLMQMTDAKEAVAARLRGIYTGAVTIRDQVGP